MSKPDAVLISPEYAEAYGRDNLSAEMKKLLGAVVWYGKDGETGLKFGRTDPTQTRMHPKGSPLEGSSRYTWYRHAPGAWLPVADGDIHDPPTDGVLLGYLAGNEPVIAPAPEIVPDVS